ncbi:MAG: leucyl aminopeptidase (aminopeptidase T) [uncultured archaeon A07HR60]|nr:MAG: leucyl aminopeptidase (aminopeptidase T) [uncultured archaeon A07HR60]
MIDMDARIRQHAETIVDHSTGIEAGDNVVIQMPREAEPLAVALHELCGDRGATPIYLNHSERAQRAFQRAADEFQRPDHRLALYEETDVFIIARGGSNVTEKSDVAPDTTAAHNRAVQEVQQERLSKTWCLTQYPTAGQAQLAGMSTDAYESFVWDAVSLDWDAQRAFQSQLAEILDDTATIRIRSGEGTDVRMSIAGNTALNDDGQANLPGGEVFSAPVRDSVEGTVHFDMPLYRYGREIEGVQLRFEDGRVTSFSADRNEDLLESILDTDDGSRYLGELGIGMNRQIDQFSYNMLFDEKMGDTVHMAVGSAYEECVGDENQANQSAEHVDMIVDMGTDSVIEADGDVIQRDGTFVFEDGFA